MNGNFHEWTDGRKVVWDVRRINGEWFTRKPDDEEGQWVKVRNKTFAPPASATPSADEEPVLRPFHRRGAASPTATTPRVERETRTHHSLTKKNLFGR